jgi:uncharacterized protein
MKTHQTPHDVSFVPMMPKPLTESTNVPTYTLRAGHADAAAYYAAVAALTDRVLARAAADVLPLVNEFETFLRATHAEIPRSTHEYVLEALTIGVLWQVYTPRGRKLSPLTTRLFQVLIALRRRGGWLKLPVDAVRGILATALLLPDPATPPRAVSYTVTDFRHLLNWPAVTGEFKEEVKRLRQWEQFWQTLPPAQMLAAGEVLNGWACWFEEESQSVLQPYTANVSTFLTTIYPQRYHWREDVILAGRQVVEYHLIMVGAEILNRAFYDLFHAMPRKVVLLPACMRARAAQTCRAKQVGHEITCVGCTPACRIAQFTQLGRDAGFEVCIVPHSSDFTAWLERWRDTREVGVVGVACVLNLFTGGYEMKDLNIPAQCVLLDYCGCQKHWHPQGIPTDLDQQQLLHILQPASKV